MVTGVGEIVRRAVLMNLRKVEERFQSTSDGKCVVAEGGMVATAFPLATQAGVEMLAQGGNAVDAACAAALALGVCEPQASGLGGQSMALIHINGRTVALDGSGRVPSLAHASLFKGNDQELGYRATTVPSTPAVLGRMNGIYGRLRWQTILEPAIRIAREGYRITALQHGLQERERPSFHQVPSQSGLRYFFKNSQEPFAPGDLFQQPELAALLEALADQGPEAFYTGRVASMVDEDMRVHDGFLRAEDLALIPWPVERPTIQATYRGMTVLTSPPPTAGRILLLDLKVLDRLPPHVVTSGSPQTLRFLAETFRRGLVERHTHPIRPDLYDPFDDSVLTEESFARSIFTSIEGGTGPCPPAATSSASGGETTHLSTMDVEGNAVGITQSINLVYGSKAAAEGLGFLYNDYLKDSETSDPGHPHHLRPNGIPWSSVTPCMVFHQGKPWLVTGSPSSDRIISVVTQFLAYIIDGEMPMCEAMKRPRIHCSMGGRVSLEADRFDPEVMDYLAKQGYEIHRVEPYSFYLGAIHAVLKRQTGRGFQGVAEIRRDGTAAGPA
jgi:gamma-glutamyltranspeptidase / glutathione hydrolase